MADFKTYSFKNVTVIFGILEIVGFADDDAAITIEQEVEQFTDIAGARGDVVRMQSNDHRCNRFFSCAIFRRAR